MSVRHSKQVLWYTRREGVVRGPYPAGQISRYILLGRIRMTDQLRADAGGHWKPVSERPELIPEVMKLPPTEENCQKLVMARMREDERRPGDRRERSPRPPAEIVERRQGHERRQPEPEAVQRHRELKRKISEPPPGTEVQYRYPVLMVAMVLVAFLAGYMLGDSETEVPGPDCAAAPAAGINWDNCNLSGAQAAGADLANASIRNARLDGAQLAHARLTGARLDYSSLGISDLREADLRQAVLVGTVLRGADLRGAHLYKANLAYANLSGAQIEGADFRGALLDQAIWTDQRVCARGSVGRCLRTPASAAE